MNECVNAFYALRDAHRVHLHKNRYVPAPIQSVLFVTKISFISKTRLAQRKRRGWLAYFYLFQFKMYHMKNIISHNEDIVLPKCMYHIKNPNESLKDEIDVINKKISNQVMKFLKVFVPIS